MNRLNGYLDSFASQMGWRQHGGYFSGVSVGDLMLQSSGTVNISGCRNVSIQVLGGSGLLQYAPGPYEGWAARMSNQPGGAPNLDGTWPLAVSGIFGLNDAYIGNPSIYINSAHGQLAIFTDDRRITMVGGRQSAFNISGVMFLPLNPTTAGNRQGDINFCAHSNIVLPNIFNPPADTSEAAARSLGPGMLTINTGSGIVNVSTGSGICMLGMAADTTLTYTLENWGRIGMSGMLVRDSMFVENITGSGVTFMVDGLYRVSYNIAVRKVLGSTARQIGVRAVLRNKGSEGETAGVPLTGTSFIPNSLSYVQVSTVTSASMATASASFLVNAKVGQFLGFEAADVQATIAAATQTTVAAASGSQAIIEYIGPIRTFPVLA